MRSIEFLVVRDETSEQRVGDGIKKEARRDGLTSLRAKHLLVVSIASVVE